MFKKRAKRGERGLKHLDKKRLRSLFILLCVGLAYFIETQTLGFTLQCPFHRITGLKCPGCGITTACIALLKGQWGVAAAANLGLAAALPLLLFFGGFALWRWLQKKTLQGRWVTVVSSMFLTFFVIWGVLRNIWGI